MARSHGLIITIDGPTGSGKSTAAGLVANQLGYVHLSARSIYRAFTLLAIREGIPVDIEAVMSPFTRSAVARGRVRLERHAHAVRVLIDDIDVDAELRCRAVTRKAPTISEYTGVWDVARQMQRTFGADGGVVLDGRRAASDTFPDADLKIYLVAQSAVRARRWHGELVRRGLTMTYEEVLADLRARDETDHTRQLGIQAQANGAIRIDSSDLTPTHVARLITEHARALRTTLDS